MFKHTLSFVASATLVASLEANTLAIQPIQVTSNVFDQNELTAPFSTEIYTSDDIAKSHAKNIYDFLTQQTSINVAPSYGNLYAQKLDFHGYGINDGYQNVVVTVNGRRLNNIDMTAPLLVSVPLSSIERIEILKGSGSVAYGDGANAGTINIITKANNDKELALYTGNYSSHGESVYFSSAKERISYSLSYDHSQTDGTRVVDTNDNRDQSKHTNTGAKISYRPTDRLELHAGAQYTSYELLYGGHLTLAQYQENPAQKASSKSHQIVHSNVLNAGLIYAPDTHYTFELDGSREVKQNDSITWGNDYRYNQINTKLNYESGNFDTTLGIDSYWGERQGLGSSNTTTKESRDAYIATKYHANDQTLNAGGRIERVDYAYHKTGNYLTQSDFLYAVELGYSLTFNPNQSIFANYSHAYQAPDIDRFFSYNFSTSTYTFNGFIQPMKTDTFTVGFNQINTNNKLKIALYYVDLTNEIYYYPTTYKNTNLDKSHKYGLDLSNTWLINNQWELYTNYNYVKAFIDKEIENGNNYANKELPGVSNHNAKATISYLPNHNTTISLTQIYRSKAYALEDLNNNFSQKQQAYRSTNLAITYAKDNYELFAKINNLFDKSNGFWTKDNTIYPIDFTTTVTAGLKYRF